MQVVSISNHLRSVIVFSHTNMSSDDKPYSIKGQVLKRGINIPCRVRLFIKATGQLFQDVATDENGYYEFNEIPLNRYYVVAHDPDGEYNAVIQDNIIPK